MDNKIVWERRPSGLLVPLGTAVNKADSDADSSLRVKPSTHWVPTATAVLAVLVAIASLAWQVANSRADAKEKRLTELRHNASLVQLWRTETHIVVQNSSPAALQLVSLEWNVNWFWASNSDPEHVDFTVQAALAPCHRWLIGIKTPELADVSNSYDFGGLLFRNSDGMWRLADNPGILSGPFSKLPYDIDENSLDWDAKYMQEESLSGCST